MLLLDARDFIVLLENRAESRTSIFGGQVLPVAFCIILWAIYLIIVTLSDNKIRLVSFLGL